MSGIRVRIKFMSMLAEVVGHSDTELIFNENCIDLKRILNKLFEVYPRLRDFEDRLIVIENGVGIDQNKVICGDTELTILPTVSGG